METEGRELKYMETEGRDFISLKLSHIYYHLES